MESNLLSAIAGALVSVIAMTTGLAFGWYAAMKMLGLDPRDPEFKTVWLPAVTEFIRSLKHYRQIVNHKTHYIDVEISIRPLNNESKGDYIQ